MGDDSIVTVILDIDTSMGYYVTLVELRRERLCDPGPGDPVPASAHNKTPDRIDQVLFP